MSSLMGQKMYKCQTKRNNNISLENEGGLVSSRRWIVFIRVFFQCIDRGQKQGKANHFTLFVSLT